MDPHGLVVSSQPQVVQVSASIAVCYVMVAPFGPGDPRKSPRGDPLDLSEMRGFIGFFVKPYGLPWITMGLSWDYHGITMDYHGITMDYHGIIMGFVHHVPDFGHCRATIFGEAEKHRARKTFLSVKAASCTVYSVFCGSFGSMVQLLVGLFLVPSGYSTLAMENAL